MRAAGMKMKLQDFFRNNDKAIIMTFEIFWILVFLLDRVIRTDSVGIPQFIYVNF